MGEARQVALIFGATGYTGLNLTRLLPDSGVRVVAHVRPSSSTGGLLAEVASASGAEVMEAPWELQAIKELVERCQPDCIFGLLGTTKKRMRALKRMGGTPESASYEAVDRDMTLMALEAARACAPDSRFVYLSAMGVSARSRTAYMKVRWEVEEALRSSGQPWMILRPGFITGPDRPESRPAERFAAAISDSALGALGLVLGAGLVDAYRSHPGAELARALIRAGFEAEETSQVWQGAALR